MLRNLTYNDREIKKEMETLVGKPYSIPNRLKMKGTGSPKYVIKNASDSIMDKLNMDNNLNYSSIELRPGGIIVSFRSLLETYGWILPFDKFSIKFLSGTYEIRSGKEYLIIENTLRFKTAERFLKKIIYYQNHFIVTNSIS